MWTSSKNNHKRFLDKQWKVAKQGISVSLLISDADVLSPLLWLQASFTNHTYLHTPKKDQKFTTLNGKQLKLLHSSSIPRQATPICTYSIPVYLYIFSLEVLITAVHHTYKTVSFTVYLLAFKVTNDSEHHLCWIARWRMWYLAILCSAVYCYYSI